MVNAIACTIEFFKITAEIHAHSLVNFYYNPPINFRAISLATLRHVLDSYHAITPVLF